jgi:hypothetical protein
MGDRIATIEATDNLEQSYDTSDPAAVNKQRKKDSRTRANRLKFVQAAMSHEEGRAWFHNLLTRCRVFNHPFVSGDPHATSFRCGELNIGNQILGDIQEAAPDKYIVMIEEGSKS